MKESRLEKWACNKIRDLGGRAFKWTCPGVNGVPDRIIFFPNGKIVFAEFKTPGERPTPQQQRRLNWLRQLGHTAVVIDSKEKFKMTARHEGYEI